MPNSSPAEVFRSILLAPLLARLLADHLDLANPPQVIIPVPLHWWRQWWRGFNQAEEIGHALSALTGIPCDTRVLRRTRSTRNRPGSVPASGDAICVAPSK